MYKTGRGYYFEDFRIGQDIDHSTPRTVTSGDVAVYNSLYPNRFALQSSDEFARACALPRAPIDDLLVFHVVFGKTVPDISLNAVANLGYADGRFRRPVYASDTLSARSRVIGLKQNSSGKNGVVYVRTTGTNQHGETVLDYVRWVMVNKRDPGAPAPETVVPALPDAVSIDQMTLPSADFSAYRWTEAGSVFRWGEYAVGEKIDHVDGVTIEEAEHMMAARLYQNTARVHFNQFGESGGRFGRRLIYGGVVISMARALSFNGLANAQLVAAINAGRHIGPLFGGETVFAWSEVLDKAEPSGRDDIGALRLRLVATKDRPCADFPDRQADGAYDPAVILDFDYWAWLPK